MDTNCCEPIDFPGRDKFVAAVDAAVVLGDKHAVTAALRNALCGLIRDNEVQLPCCVQDAIVDHYARRELYRSAMHGYSLVAMTWGPGQGTKIHDHSGMWCVEGMWRGRLEITQYELAERDDVRYRFVPAGTIEAGTGSAGSLIPPHEYHTIRNPSDKAIAVSLHVYQRTMVRCGIFTPEDEAGGGGWQRRGERLLGTDQVN